MTKPTITATYLLDTSFKPPKKLWRHHCDLCKRAWGGYHTEIGAKKAGERHAKKCGKEEA